MKVQRTNQFLVVTKARHPIMAASHLRLTKITGYPRDMMTYHHLPQTDMITETIVVLTLTMKTGEERGKKKEVGTQGHLTTDHTTAPLATTLDMATLVHLLLILIEDGLLVICPLLLLLGTHLVGTEAPTVLATAEDHLPLADPGVPTVHITHEDLHHLHLFLLTLLPEDYGVHIVLGIEEVAHPRIDRGVLIDPHHPEDLLPLVDIVAPFTHDEAHSVHAIIESHRHLTTIVVTVLIVGALHLLHLVEIVSLTVLIVDAAPASLHPGGTTGAGHQTAEDDGTRVLLGIEEECHAVHEGWAHFLLTMEKGEEFLSAEDHPRPGSTQHTMKRVRNGL